MTSPIARQQALSDMAMHAGKGPIRRRLAPAMFDRVEMHVIDSPREVDIVANRVFPIATLPDLALAFAQTAGVSSIRGVDGMGKAALQQPPSCGIVIVAFRQAPDDMQMLGQHHRCNRHEWSFHAGAPISLAQRRNVFDQQPVARSMREVDGEEIGAPGHPMTDVCAHPPTLQARRSRPYQPISISPVGFPRCP